MGKIVVTDRAGDKHEVEMAAGDNLMDPLREMDAGIEALCGGMCSCATCHVFVDETWADKFPGREMDEEELLEFLDHFQPNSRLSCQLELKDQHDGLVVKLAPEE